MMNLGPNSTLYINHSTDGLPAVQVPGLWWSSWRSLEDVGRRSKVLAADACNLKKKTSDGDDKICISSCWGTNPKLRQTLVSLCRCGAWDILQSKVPDTALEASQCWPAMNLCKVNCSWSMVMVCDLCTKTHVSGISMCTSRLPNDGEALDDRSKMLLQGGGRDDDSWWWWWWWCMFNSRSKSLLAMMKYV